MTPSYLAVARQHSDLMSLCRWVVEGYVGYAAVGVQSAYVAGCSAHLVILPVAVTTAPPFSQ